MLFSDRYFKNLFENCEGKEGYTPKEAIKILTKARMYEHIKVCIKNNGLEGAEEVIKKVYKTAPKLRVKMLKVLYEVWKG